MSTSPDFDAFREAYEAGRAQVAWTTLVADLETPVSAMLKLADGRANAFLLESVEGGAVRGRYSIIGLKPDVIWRFYKDKAEINRRARIDLDAFEPITEAPLASLRALIAESRIDLPAEVPPMAAGLFGYMGYDAIRLFEDIPDENPDTLGIQDGIMLRPTIVCVFDNIDDMVTIITPVYPSAGMSAAAAHAAAAERLADVVSDFERSLPYRREAAREIDALPEPVSNTGREAYHDMVRRTVDYINAGDAFQVVPSHRMAVPFSLPPFALYRSLRRLNPSPFLFFFDFGDYAIVGSSPEILVRLRDGVVTIRPLAGTRKRGATAEEDAALAEDLLSDPKERAEHLMLLDLGRNDVGRVAEIGSVEVKDQFTIERYSHVMHIASHVDGRLAEDKDVMEALFAGFPAGTVSGAPKVRAMEIIDELEVSRRGIYAGAVGYLSANAMDTCIALRTALVKDGTMYVQAGGGVVADSNPEDEWQETLNKARALIRAAEEAVRFAARRS